jgi:hypothetical protein
MKYWEIIADNLSKAGWSWGCVSVIDSEGRTIWITDADRGDGKRFSVRADEKLTAFSGTGIAAYPDAAQCRTRPYILSLTEYWTFWQPAPASSPLGVSPQELHLTLFPQGKL